MHRELFAKQGKLVAKKLELHAYIHAHLNMLDCYRHHARALLLQLHCYQRELMNAHQTSLSLVALNRTSICLIMFQKNISNNAASMPRTRLMASTLPTCTT
jgi:hypothetical protein